MKIIARELQELVEKWLFKGKVITIYGPRQAGKTTLAKLILAKQGSSENYYDCELLSVRRMLDGPDLVVLKRVLAGKKLIVLDEAQRVSNIGVVLKVLHDHMPELQIIATGSSSFELANSISEPLTGRGLEFTLYPLSLRELSTQHAPHELLSTIKEIMVTGAYPEIVTAVAEDTKILLENLTNKYLYKDILEYETIKRPDLLAKLLQLLAFQVGQEVSIHELAVSLQTKSETVKRYLDMLEKCMVIFKLTPLSRNLRKEITKKNKIYFLDLGIRNSLISQYNSLSQRDDIGKLWENFCVLERLKYRQYAGVVGNHYFWRTHDGKEIDYIEEYDGKMHGYEFKWQASRYKVPREFLDAYADSQVVVITNQNYWDFLVGF